MEIDLKTETIRIIKFIQDIRKKTGLNKIVLGLSGGIDSATSLYLLNKSIPPEDIIIAHLYYFKPEKLEELIKDIPKQNIHFISIKETVDNLCDLLKISENQIRKGNIAARIRMIILYDLAKKYNGLVCGTENKSENLLGYFTRFGDWASDFEPIEHLYKTQVYKLAEYLKVPKEIIEKKPTAGLWLEQTDEEELGFIYKEADQVLYMYFEQKLSVKEIKKQGFKNGEKILETVNRNKFKHKVPYKIK